MRTLSIVIPCYNEEKRILETLYTLEKIVSEIYTTVISIVLVNDGSTDNTGIVLENIGKNLKLSICIVSYQLNRGKGYAVKQGIQAKSADYYLIMDADGATDSKEIKNFLNVCQNDTVVVGCRVSNKAKRVWYKKIIGYFSHLLITTVLGLHVKDTQCGFKLFPHSVKHIWDEMILDRWGFDFEFLYLLKKYGYTVREELVVWHEIKGSKIQLYDYFNTLKELYEVKRVHGEKKPVTIHGLSVLLLKNAR